jgi:hypothetical protein
MTLILWYTVVYSGILWYTSGGLGKVLVYS